MKSAGLEFSAPFSPRLHQHAEGAAKMVGMREGLKLAGLTGPPFAKEFLLDGGFQNTREKLRLGAKFLRPQTGGFARCLNRREINVRGQILFAGIRQ